MKLVKDTNSLSPSQNGPLPPILVFPLSAHQGNPAIPIVKPGESVKLGQLIARANGQFSANIHSSVSGEITSIENWQYPDGSKQKAIIIKNDNKNSKTAFYPVRTIKGTTKEELLQRILDAGIVGMGGAMFPTHLKLSSAHRISEVIINAAESEPGVTCDNRVIVEQTKYLFYGIDAIKEILNPAIIYIPIKDINPETIYAARSYALRYKNVKVVTIPSTFPIGAEKVLVRHITKKRIRKTAVEHGILVINSSTTQQIGYSLTTGMPFTERTITVGGDMINKKTNLRIRIGTPLKYIIGDKVAPLLESGTDIRVTIGGNMIGFSQSNLEAPVLKGTNSIFINRHVSENSYDCIGCGRCVDHCPIFLIPTFAAKKGIQAEHCMECGNCSYYCPSKINLVQLIRQRKMEIKK